jgi:hypothetical protein
VGAGLGRRECKAASSLSRMRRNRRTRQMPGPTGGSRAMRGDSAVAVGVCWLGER